MSELIDQTITALRRDEGERLYAYADSLGLLTIGVGRLIDRRGGGISRVESAMLLSNDLETKQRDLDTRWPWWRTLSPARQGVLLNMCFQLGGAGLAAFALTLKMIEQGEYEPASKEMLRSLWAGQTPERAQRLSRQLATGVWAP